MRFAVSNEVDLMLPLLLLQAVFCATVVAHAAAAQNEDDRPNHPKPCQTQAAAFRVQINPKSTHLPPSLVLILPLNDIKQKTQNE